MRLIEVLERQTGYLIFIRSNHVSFYKVQCAIFCQTVFHPYSILAHTFPDFFPVGKCLYEIPDFFPTFPDRGNPASRHNGQRLTNFSICLALFDCADI